MYCKYCGKDKPKKNFQLVTVNGKEYARKKCTQCKDADQDKRLLLIRTAIENYKKEHPCIRCGFSDYRALQFHHRDSEQKVFSIGDATQHGFSLMKIMEEIEKCDVLCANCHFTEHYSEIRCFA